ncbi:MAG: DNA polymerase III subunit alpha [Gemmatimonadetes bacterium]|nr:DNA polymerase III subunit alpha [Gemmatimonadota bacterium]
MYVELHCHSAYSFLDGTSQPDALVLQARALGYPALALTDHNGLYGSMAFAQAAKQMELQAITGAEVTLLDGSHVTLLTETPGGYATLCRLITEAHLRREDRRDPRLDLASLEARHEGLIILSGCRTGLIPTVLAREGYTAARRLAARCRAVFGRERFFIELQRNSVRGDRDLTRALGDIADAEGLDVVATGDVHYHRRERHRLHDVLTALRHRRTLDGSHDVRRANSEFYLRPPHEMVRIFADRPDAVAHTLTIAERCASFDLTRDLGYSFPDFRGSNKLTAPRALAELCRGRMDEFYPVSSPLREEATRRLEEELRLVDHHGLSGFFLVYHDIFELAREVAADVRRGSRRATGSLLPGRGRGSSVSSIICYFLGLSHIDPIESRLFIGRFLNEELASVPDIDLDFPREIRAELIRRVYTRYGHEHVGLVCTFPTYRLRSAVREIGKALDLPLGEIEQIAKLASSFSSAAGIREEMRRLPGLEGKIDAPLWRDLCDLAEDIAGLPRHISQHPGGMIISSRPLVEIVPLERSAMPDRVLCQWDKDSCDDARFVKIDFLALGMLSLVEECVELVAKKEGSPPDLSRIDFDDSDIYDRICKGDTVGLFQIESRAQIQMIRRVRPRNLADLAVQVAIVRPGPIVGGAVNPYVRRREAQRRALEAGRHYDPPVDHPLLKEPLAETLGVIIFQDQVLQVCQTLAGFSAGQAEALRRAMSRRRSRELLEGFWEEFRYGAAAKGVSEEVAQRVFKQVVAFSAFGFPKSHAAAFGLLAYQSAWLFHYHPVEYYTALFNNQPMGFYSIDALGRDAARHGIGIRLPDVNASDVWCTVESCDVRVGLGFIREWNEDRARAVVEERERNGSYLSLGDFVRRAPPDLSRNAIEYLVWVGGCDAFGLTRRELLWQVGLWLPPKHDRDPKRVRRQLELPLEHPHEHLRFGRIDAREKLLAEYATLGFAASGHPLTLLDGSLPPGITRSDQLPLREHGDRVEVIGLVVARQRPQTAKGFVFILMEDERGMINAIVHPDIYERDRVAIRGEPFLRITGKLAKDDGTLNIIAQQVRALKVPRATPAPASNLSSQSPYRFLQSVRQIAPGSKDWG